MNNNKKYKNLPVCCGYEELGPSERPLGLFNGLPLSRFELLLAASGHGGGGVGDRSRRGVETGRGGREGDGEEGFIEEGEAL